MCQIHDQEYGPTNYKGNNEKSVENRILQKHMWVNNNAKFTNIVSQCILLKKGGKMNLITPPGDTVTPSTAGNNLQQENIDRQPADSSTM